MTYGDFSFRTGWNKPSDLSITNTAAPQLDGWVLRLYGNPMTQNRVMQELPISGNQGDTYILGGWAWADSVPLTAYDTRDREFGLVADETWTEYGYDAMFRMVRSKVFADTGNLEATYTYTDDLLTELKTGTTTYSFEYGDFALRSEILVGETSLGTYAYESRTNLLNTLAYGNGDSVQYTYDDLGRIKVQTYEDGSTVVLAQQAVGAIGKGNSPAPSSGTYRQISTVAAY